MECQLDAEHAEGGRPGTNSGLALRASEDLWFQNPPQTFTPNPGCLAELLAGASGWGAGLGVGVVIVPPAPAHRWAWRK